MQVALEQILSEDPSRPVASPRPSHLAVILANDPTFGAPSRSWIRTNILRQLLRYFM